ncbi:nuclear mitotic apparatus protein 1 [Clupea harengus]|uniref:Nuclear mitotic apparatus protein 1 n=1 Tax=Clupea harengus TaxID=7950 RepID=A0A8M1KGM3_CLUHA|nr:nuclear mitotic apparatus protein 1 [Clupea harengus]
MASGLFHLQSQDYNTELELVSMFRHINENESGYYLNENIECFLSGKTLLDKSSSSSSSDVGSPFLNRKTSVRFLELSTVASNAVSSPIQELMSTPQYQLSRLRRQVVQEEQARDELEKELSTYMSRIQEKGLERAC